MSDIGEVVEIKDNNIVIKIERQSACRHCGICLESQDEKIMLLEAENTIQANIGDRVKLELPGGTILLASFIVYIVPLICFLAALIAAHYYKPENQTFVLVVGLCGLGGSVFICKFFDDYLKNKKRMKMEITKI